MAQHNPCMGCRLRLRTGVLRAGSACASRPGANSLLYHTPPENAVIPSLLFFPVHKPMSVSSTSDIASPTASSPPDTHYTQSSMVMFIAVICGVVGFCILVAMAVPLLFWWRRKQKRRAKGGSGGGIDLEKEPADGWLPEHAHGEPLLMNDARSSTDGSTRKPHYRLASEGRPLQPADYVLDLYRPSSHDEDIDDGDDEQKKYLVPRFSYPTPSPLSAQEFFLVQPEDPPQARNGSSETIMNGDPSDAMVHDDDTAMQETAARETTAQVDLASPREKSKAAVSRSSTLSTVSAYSQTTLPSPQQDSSTTPSLSAFPLPPPMSAPAELISPTKTEMKIQSPDGDTAIINYLVMDRPRVPARSPRRPTTGGSHKSHMTTIMEPQDEP